MCILYQRATLLANRDVMLSLRQYTSMSSSYNKRYSLRGYLYKNYILLVFYTLSKEDIIMLVGVVCQEGTDIKGASKEEMSPAWQFEGYHLIINNKIFVRADPDLLPSTTAIHDVTTM